MSKVLPPANLDERAQRTEAVLAKFRDKPWAWERRTTCIHLFRAQVAAMGHSISPVPEIRSVTGAKRVLRGLGHEKLETLFDELLPGRRIPAARLLLGDIVLLPGEPFEAVTIATGSGAKVIGWHHANEMAEMVAIDLSRAEWSAAVIGCWRLG